MPNENCRREGATRNRGLVGATGRLRPPWRKRPGALIKPGACERRRLWTAVAPGSIAAVYGRLA